MSTTTEIVNATQDLSAEECARWASTGYASASVKGAPRPPDQPTLEAAVWAWGSVHAAEVADQMGALGDYRGANFVRQARMRAQIAFASRAVEKGLAVAAGGLFGRKTYDLHTGRCIATERPARRKSAQQKSAAQTPIVCLPCHADFEKVMPGGLETMVKEHTLRWTRREIAERVKALQERGEL